MSVVKPILACLALCLFLSVQGQDKAPFKFGKVSPADFNVKPPANDTGAHAIILADVGDSRVVANNKGGFSYEFERKMRGYIVDIKGVDLGEFNIDYYIARDGGKEEVSGLKGYTYNLEGGKVVETKLENSQVFTEKGTRNYMFRKFSMPQLKAGSIFEISYTITSPFLFNFRPWTFQGQYPRQWSEYNIEVPEYFDYVFLSQGYLPFHINTNKQVARTYLIRDNSGTTSSSQQAFTLNGNALQKRWVIKDVPALREEGFTTTVRNHISKIEFQLSSIRYPNQPIKMVMENWTKVSDELMEREDFGYQLSRQNGWLDDIVKEAIGNSTDPEEKTRKMYTYVRDNYTCTSGSGFLLTSGIKNVVKTKSGNVADLNLLLVALLRHENIESYPIILSTRSNGYTNEVYPLLDRYNYVACGAIIGEKDFLLDASDPNVGFGKLPLKCYNGHARVLTKETVPLDLNPASLTEKSLTLVIMRLEGNEIRGSLQAEEGYYESVNDRTKIRENGKDALVNAMRKEFGSDFSIENFQVDSLKKLDEPIKLRFDFEFPQEDQDLLYISPVIGESFRENPFKAAERNYPVEMPYCLDRTYVLNFSIPEGYKVEELPKSSKVAFNDDEGYFEYLISADANAVQMRTRIQLRKSVFQPDEYNSLRDFFSYVVKKHAEQIVLKKK